MWLGREVDIYVHPAEVAWSPGLSIYKPALVVSCILTPTTYIYEQ
jgi:hypothetical protein